MTRSSGLTQISSNGLIIEVRIAVLRAIIAQERPAILGDGLDIHRTFPHPVQGLKHALSVVKAQRSAVKFMVKQQLPAILEVAVLHVNEGLAEICQLRQQLLLNLLKLPALDLPIPRLTII